MHNSLTMVMEEEWDFLIILDACRYDCFARVFGDFLEGKLEKAVSAGGATVEWRDRSFPDTYENVVYVSSNPYINSVAPIKGFLGSDHFARVLDVWADGWDRARGTVLPETVTSAAVEAIAENRGKRFIIHYLQPHAPYLGVDLDGSGFPVPDVAGDHVLAGVSKGEDAGGWRGWLLDSLTWVFYKVPLLGQNPTWKLRQILRMAPASPMDAVRRKGGDQALRSAYEENLRIVLSGVAELMPYLSGRIIVTADHGEYLGEDGCYSHWAGSESPHLREVPWLVIDRDSADKDAAAEVGRKKAGPGAGAGPGGRVFSEEDQKKIEERLKDLGYIE